MGGSYFGDAGIFLIETVIGLYLLVVILRFLFQLLRADFYNPISQFVVNITNPPLRFLRRFVPGMWGIDLSSVVLAFCIALIKIYLIAAISGISLPISAGILITIAELLKTTVYIFMFVTIARAILSWFAQSHYHPLNRLLYSLSEPLLGPIRRILPPIGGLDLTPLALIILLTLVLKLIVRPIVESGIRIPM